MIKKALITKMYQINMYCDKCGKRMDRTNITYPTNPPIFEYKCECGYIEKSNNIYPYQQVFFDEESSEEMEG